jgi:Rrf2 family transcriptional regulator, nitric oxide-sensitive transcriptional repressor
MLTDTTEYAMRAMVCLAFAKGDYATSAALAKRATVPAPYLIKVLQQLAASGLVSSQRGLGGGWALAKKPEEISLLDIIRVVQPVERIRECPLELENHGNALCLLHETQDRAAQALIEVYGQRTLADVLDAKNNKPLCDPAQTAELEISMGKSKKK